MDFTVLGPLGVRRKGVDVELRRGRARRLLLALLATPGEAIPRHVLVELVWGDEAPEHPTGALQGLVSYLRRAIRLPAEGFPRLETVGDGYLLEVAPGQVDADRFERLVTAAAGQLRGPWIGAAVEAEAELDAALALWRGQPFQELGEASFAIGEVIRLQELRATAEQLRIDAQLRQGRHDEAIPRLQGLVVRHPLRERLRAQLMLALYRAGRQAEALRLFDSTRQRLVEELGVDPAPDLQELHWAILTQDPSLTWHPPTRERARQHSATGGRRGCARELPWVADTAWHLGGGWLPPCHPRI